ncbi:uncharacterized protein LOC114288611 [Camellia sinensis]|uniref:uncharacterized protein LOC114288611 n=1 Tax=Camellia sinensis TaxID=4442 RepID=UPI001036E331|nr:uncharacterized protein LOC114288611 [Camellia sinensis]
MLVNDSDFSKSDNDLEMFKAVTMDEELLDSEMGSSSRRGSVRGYKVIHRDHIQDHEKLFLNYFAKSLIYPPGLFRRRFQMKRSLFLRIQATEEAHNPMLAYGVAADFMDDYVRIGERTAIESLKYFVKEVVYIFSNEYLRSPNSNDIAKLLTAFFELPGSHNDINVLEMSFVCTELAQGRALAVNYTINGN